MLDKRISLSEAIASISDGARVALGGNTLHRGPSAAVHEIVRQRKQGLEIVKTAGAYDIDVLAATGCAATVAAGFVGFETVLGLAPGYRRAVEQGRVAVKEHACYTVIAGLRAAVQGVPFMPVAGLTGSGVPQVTGFHTLTDPYTGEHVIVVPRLQPDVAIIHVQEADLEGNARIWGTRFEDVLMAQAARRVIVTAEQIVDGAIFEAAPETVAIPGFLVEAVVEAPRGAWPCSCAGCYGYDEAYLRAYAAASSAGEDAVWRFLEEHVLRRAPAEVGA
jgi:glutaconate CoA-transferase subunit A